MNWRAWLVGLIALVGGCASSSGDGAARDTSASVGPAERLDAGATSADGTLRVTSITFAEAGGPSARGRTSVIRVANAGAHPVDAEYTVRYFSHTGAPLGYVVESYLLLHLGAGETGTIEHRCPFRTARRVVLELAPR